MRKKRNTLAAMMTKRRKIYINKNTKTWSAHFRLILHKNGVHIFWCFVTRLIIHCSLFCFTMYFHWSALFFCAPYPRTFLSFNLNADNERARKRKAHRWMQIRLMLSKELTLGIIFHKWNLEKKTTQQKWDRKKERKRCHKTMGTTTPT